MEISDSGIVIVINRHGESFFKLKVFSSSHGLVAGMCRLSRRAGTASLMIGSVIYFDYKIKDNNDSGWFSLEIQNILSTNILDNNQSLLSLQLIAKSLELSVPHMHAEFELYKATAEYIFMISKQNFCFEILIEYKINMLKNLGFALDFKTCAVTGVKDNLEYISPKTGRAVSHQTAMPYVKMLIKMPKYISHNSRDKGDISEMINMLSFFISKFLFSRRSGPVFDAYQKILQNLVSSI